MGAGRSSPSWCLTAILTACGAESPTISFTGLPGMIRLVRNKTSDAPSTTTGSISSRDSHRGILARRIRFGITAIGFTSRDSTAPGSGRARSAHRDLGVGVVEDVVPAIRGRHEAVDVLVRDEPCVGPEQRDHGVLLALDDLVGLLLFRGRLARGRLGGNGLDDLLERRVLERVVVIQWRGQV